VQAHRLLGQAHVRGRQRKETVDRSAAAILLQSYLDSRSGAVE
jgi:RNase H-fold protein (predicted Holliday junction resolvase)